MNILIVRLGALGDVVHAIPAAAALRRAFPDARIDWLVEARHRPVVDLVTVLDRSIAIERSSLRGWSAAVPSICPLSPRKLTVTEALDGSMVKPPRSALSA